MTDQRVSAWWTDCPVRVRLAARRDEQEGRARVPCSGVIWIGFQHAQSPQRRTSVSGFGLQKTNSAQTCVGEMGVFGFARRFFGDGGAGWEVFRSRAIASWESLWCDIVGGRWDGAVVDGGEGALSCRVGRFCKLHLSSFLVATVELFYKLRMGLQSGYFDMACIYLDR